MANYLTTDTDLASVADAIRAKGGTSAQLAFPEDFVDAIEAIVAGGGGGLELLGSGTYTKTGASAAITIPVSFSGTPKLWYYYNTTPVDSTAQCVAGFNFLPDQSDLVAMVTRFAAHRLRNSSNAYIWSSSPQFFMPTATTMTCQRPGASGTHQAGEWKWFIYGEAAS